MERGLDHPRPSYKCMFFIPLPLRFKGGQVIKNPHRPPHKGGFLVPLPLWEGLGEGEKSRNTVVYEYQINPLPLPLPQGEGRRRENRHVWNRRRVHPRGTSQP